MEAPDLDELRDKWEIEETGVGSRALAIAAMRVTQLASGYDFLRRLQIQTPVPAVAGAIPAHARVPFPETKTGLPIDLLVVWAIGDFYTAPVNCSSYYDHDEAWYNTFYGTYGMRSKKADGLPWGFDDDRGTKPDYQEMLEVPKCDYNVLTAGELGCPPAKQTFNVIQINTGMAGRWFAADVTVEIPSGLHGLYDAVNANALYYTVFGFPDSNLAKKAPSSYEKVRMRGQMFFRLADGKEKITLCWGAMAPDTAKGQTLVGTIVATMMPLYP
jgi:hypothetical protein